MQKHKYAPVEDFRDATIDGTCSNCGDCCTEYLPLTNLEIERIKEYVKENNIKEQPYKFGNNVHVKCPFRDNKNKKCLIYPVRPSICSTFICNLSKEIIEENRDNHIELADINGIPEKTPTISLRYLIYDNIVFEADVISGLAKGNIFTAAIIAKEWRNPTEPFIKQQIQELMKGKK